MYYCARDWLTAPHKCRWTHRRDTQNDSLTHAKVAFSYMLEWLSPCLGLFNVNIWLNLTLRQWPPRSQGLGQARCWIGYNSINTATWSPPCSFQDVIIGINAVIPQAPQNLQVVCVLESRPPVVCTMVTVLPHYRIVQVNLSFIDLQVAHPPESVCTRHDRRGSVIHYG